MGADTEVAHGNLAAAAFAETWASFSPRLVRMLVARGADRHTAEEVAQETGFRVWKRGLGFGCADDLRGYSWKVASNLLASGHRRSGRFVGGEPPEVADVADVARNVEDRMRLDAVLDHLESLDVAHRQAIAFELVGRPEWNDSEYRMWKMRLSRARKKLRALVDGAVAAVFPARVWRWAAGRVTPESLAAVGSLLPAVAAVVAAAVTPPPAPSAPATAASVVRAVAVPVAVPAVPSPVSAAEAGPGTPTPPVASSSEAPAAPSAPARQSMLATPGTDRQAPEGTVTDYDDDDLRVCTEDYPVLGTGCPVSLNPWAPLDGLRARRL